MTLQDLLPYLDRPHTGRKGEIWAFCPCHPDGTKYGRRSLKFCESDGKILAHCFAGCLFKDIVAALGLKASDFFAEQKQTKRQSTKNQSEIVATYDYRDAEGNLLYQVCRLANKQFRQRRPDGSGGFVWNLKGVNSVLYRLPEFHQVVKDGELIFVPEGEKDCENLAKLGLTATTNSGGAGKWRPEFAESLKGACVIVLPDNDEAGRKHAEQVAQSLQGKAASVRVLELPNLPEKGDVSDWLVDGGTKERLLQLAADCAEWQQPAGGQEANRKQTHNNKIEGSAELITAGYAINTGRLCFLRFSDKGDAIPVPLCNFVAEVTQEIVKDDGIETQQEFEIEGKLAAGQVLPKLRVSKDKFSAMHWPLDWGMKAVISAGQGARDKMREAIQLLSQDAARDYIFTHIGWRKITDEWVYLHAGGAVGARNLSVIPGADSLRNYVLPDTGDTLSAVRKSLELLNITSREVTLPLLSAVYRAPTTSLLYPDLTLFLYGQTGSFKSTIAALFLCHYGQFTLKNLPESWLSTENALEKSANLCHDAILVIDDYAPESNVREAAALDKRVNRFIRQVGNRAGRGRLRSDLTSRPAYLPNCLPLATGEQLPLGISSVAARMLPVEVLRKEVDLELLSEAQKTAAVLPVAMRGYLEWLRPQMDDLTKALARRFTQLRDEAQVAGHARLPEIVANLHIGAEMGLRFAVEIGAIKQSEADVLLSENWSVLIALANKHAKVLQQERPVMQFLRTLEALFTQRLAHLADRTSGNPPTNGVTKRSLDVPQFSAGKKIGWIDDSGIYLQPAAAWAVVNEFNRYGDRIAVRERTMREMLAREGVSVTREGRLTFQARCENKVIETLHITHEKLEALLLVDTAYSAYSGKKQSENSVVARKMGVGTFEPEVPTSAYESAYTKETDSEFY